MHDVQQGRKGAQVIAVARDGVHAFSKPLCESITLIAGHGVEGDAHRGVTVQHRSRVAKNPAAPNLRQVHLIHSELFDELRAGGFDIKPGQIGENVTTRGIDLLALPPGTRLQLGEQAVVEVTGLRNPCYQLDNYQQGLTQAVLGRDAEGNLLRKTGVMSIVIAGGTVKAGDTIGVTLPAAPHLPLPVV